jgi:hypothetical protein
MSLESRTDVVRLATQRRWAGLAIVIAAIALFARIEIIVWRQNFTPVIEALPATQSTVGPVSFTVERAGRYQVALRLERPDEAGERPACLLGIRSAGCPNAQPVIDLVWALGTDGPDNMECSGGGPVSGWIEGDAYGPDHTVQRLFEICTVQTGRTHNLTVILRADHSALQPFHPRIVVDATAGFGRDLLGERLWSWAMSFAALVLGGLLIATSIRLKYLRPLIYVLALGLVVRVLNALQ